MILQGKVEGYDGDTLIIKAACPDLNKIIKQKVTTCEIRLDDGRTISEDQRNKIYATLKDISAWSGHTLEEIKALCKYDFIEKTGCDYFSFSNVDMTTARNFLTYLVEFCIENNVPCKVSLLERTPDIEQYVYVCLKNKKCCVTGDKAELHHVDAVGMGRDREEIIHQGMRVLPLTRKLHTEAHAIGQQSFLEKYHLVPIRLDEELCQVWHVKGEKQ